MPAPISVRPSEDRMWWIVRYTCCHSRPNRFHDWTVANRIAFGHRCPPPFEKANFPRPKRLTRTVR